MGKLIYGAGINDASYRITNPEGGGRARCPIYVIWSGMLARAFSNRYLDKYPSYKGCSVCDEWLLFSNFRLWVVCQDWEGKDLDKDILIPGNKEYSPSTCCFVDHKLNLLLIHNQITKSPYPTGVHFGKSNNKYMARIRIDGVQRYLGQFSSPGLAETAYIKAKTAEIRRQGREQTDPRIMIGLFRHAHALEQKLA